MPREMVAEPKTTHTPGPWVYDKHPIVGAADGCEVRSEGESPDGAYVCLAYSEVDARLIASAPELLETCRMLLVAVAAAMRVVADLDAMHLLGADAATREARLVDELRVSGVKDGFGVLAKAVIAKVEGRSA